MSFKTPVLKNKKTGVALISGGGSNLQAIINRADDINLTIKLVISNNHHAYGIKRANNANIPTLVLDHKVFLSRSAFDQALSQTIDKYHPDVIILAGFMRILTSNFVSKYEGIMLNIHPSLLPKFQGLNTHQKALDAKETTHGASVHFVTVDLDSGPVIAQSSIDVKDDDTVSSLAKRVLVKEHQLFPKVIDWFTNDRLKLKNNHSVLDGKIL